MTTISSTNVKALVFLVLIIVCLLAYNIYIILLLFYLFSSDFFTGSYPHLLHGLHLNILQNQSIHHLKKPNAIMVSFVYSLQLGINLQCGTRLVALAHTEWSRLIYFWYMSIIWIDNFCSVFIPLFYVYISFCKTHIIYINYWQIHKNNYKYFTNI